MTDDERIAQVESHFVATIGRRRVPRFWADADVRRLLILAHGFAKVDQARQAIIDQFGKARTPGRSSINRFWQSLDAFWKFAK